MNWPVLIPVAIAIIGAVGAYLASVRRLSGTVATSTAEDLWAESRSIRLDYQQRIRDLVEQIERCQERIDELDKRNQVLSLENGHLKQKLDDHEVTIAALRDEIHRLTDDNLELRQQNTQLKERVKELEAINDRPE